MGVCNSDPLAYLIQNYGGDVAKYIVSLKSEQFIDETTPKFADRVQEQFKNTAKTFDQEFNNKEKAINDNFTTAVNDVKKSNPGVLQTAAKTQNKSESQLFGLDSISVQFDKLRSQKDGKLKQQESSLLRVIGDKKESLKTEVRNARPSLPLFDNMPLCLRQKVLSDGQEKFAPQIKAGQENITRSFEQVTNLGNLDAEIKKAAGLDQADRLVKDSKSTFDKAKKAMTFASNPRSCFG